MLSKLLDKNKLAVIQYNVVRGRYFGTKAANRTPSMLNAHRHNGMG